MNWIKWSSQWAAMLGLILVYFVVIVPLKGFYILKNLDPLEKSPDSRNKSALKKSQPHLASHFKRMF